MKNRLQPGRPAVVTALLWIALATFVLGALFLGASWGFPTQDDVYLIHLLRTGGPELISRTHPDRPVVGQLMAASARLAGERQTIYIMIALVGWALLAGEAAWLWVLLFPQWSGAACVAALAVLAPAVNRIQFTTVMTTIPCTIPVVLVLAALILLLRRPEEDAGLERRIAAVILVAAAALISEYALAAVFAASALALVLGRRRSVLWLGGGLSIGYVAFRSISDVTLRKVTDPGAQLDLLLEKPWSVPFQLLSSVWSSVVGAWGRAASEVQWDWSSKSTILAALAALPVAAIAVTLAAQRNASDPAEQTGRPLLALFAAVVVGSIPVVMIEGWPRRLFYDTRFQLPILAFASCLTVAIVMVLARTKWRALALGAMAFVAADQLIVRAAEMKRMQPGFERFGRRLLPIVQRADGLVVLVVSEQTGLVAEETFKITNSWAPGDAERFWVEDARIAADRIGPRTGCRDPNTIVLPQKLRWIRTQEKVAEVLWESSGIGAEPLEPYFLGCSDR
jgi:hypothetical protein